MGPDVTYEFQEMISVGHAMGLELHRGRLGVT